MTWHSKEFIERLFQKWKPCGHIQNVCSASKVCVCVCVLPLQHYAVEFFIRQDIFRHLHICCFSSNVKVPTQSLPLQHHAQELLTGLQVPQTQRWITKLYTETEVCT